MISSATIAAPIGRLTSSERQPRRQQQHAQDLLRRVGHGGERVRREHRQRFDLRQPLVRRLRGGERRADHGALDPAESAPDRSPRFQRLLGRDQVPGPGPLEVVGLLPEDPDVAVPSNGPAPLLAHEVSLSPWPFSARRAHALAAAQWPRGALIGNRRSAALLGVDERSRCRLFDTVVAQDFAEATITAGDWCVCVCR